MKDDAGSVTVICPCCSKRISVSFGFDVDISFDREGDAALCDDSGYIEVRENTDPVTRVELPECGEVIETVRAGFEAVPNDGRRVRRFGSRSEAVRYVLGG